MKIGILTFHRAENFGAVLQCYALQTFLQNNGYDVEVIDYRNETIENGYKLFTVEKGDFFLCLKSIVKSLFTLVVRIKKKIYYKKFRNNFIRISRNRYSDSSFSNSYDVLICGSDQIWNTRLTGGFDYCYFLDFDTKACKLAYAASSEQRDYRVLDDCVTDLKRIFKTYTGRSVREKKFADYLYNILKVKFEAVVDPTFLLDKNIYQKIAIKPKKDNYILVYNLIDNGSCVHFAQQLSNETGLTLKIINAEIKPVHKNNIALNPRQLLGYIANAKYIFTNSFHGLSLSLILNKQVYVVKTDYSTRLEDLLNSLDLSDRILEPDLHIFRGAYMDYSEINKKINIKVNESKRFLLDSIRLCEA